VFVVYTTLERPGNSSVSLNYFLRDGGIFNVVADGVSDLSLRRADYNSIVKKEGYASLLAHLRNKIKQARDRQ
ncbi:MAG: ABC transporter substrate-binding protein, partial [Pseudomonadales bacterium]